MKEKKREDKKEIVEKKNFPKNITKKNFKKNFEKKLKYIKFKRVIKQKIIIDNKNKEKRIKIQKKIDKIQIEFEFDIDIFFKHKTSKFEIAIDINCANTIIKIFLKTFILLRKNQLRIQLLAKLALIAKINKIDKKVVCKILNIIKESTNQNIMQIINAYSILVFLNSIRIDNNTKINNILSYAKSYIYYTNLVKFFKRKSYILTKNQDNISL